MSMLPSSLWMASAMGPAVLQSSAVLVMVVILRVIFVYVPLARALDHPWIDYRIMGGPRRTANTPACQVQVPDVQGQEHGLGQDRRQDAGLQTVEEERGRRQDADRGPPGRPADVEQDADRDQDEALPLQPLNHRTPSSPGSEPGRAPVQRASAAG